MGGNMREAMFYKKLNGNKVQCELCPHFCVILPDEEGLCRSRKNYNGRLIAENYGRTVTISLDPIEKKPLFHYYPGKNILSLGPNSCNFACEFCQNYQISQQKVPTYRISSEYIIELCQKYDTDMVAFTYTEPFTWYEFIWDSAKILQENGIKIVMVTNGFVNPEPLKQLLPFIDAMNIDLKSMGKNFYTDICHGRRDPVLQTIKIAATSCHVEITNLIITNENDSDDAIEAVVNFLSEVDENIPIHFSKYFPHYKMSNGPTSDATLYNAYHIAKNKLNYVYLGNILSENETRCPNCGNLLVKRDFGIKSYLKDNHCPQCGQFIYGKF
ncbi:MAG: pyruvate formate lyase activating enzyme [Candidatus Cloacimonadota bacterium]|jgi:pyruvate formate lyase activating enzyme|nr:pyruvate formate lyase activating enzyme [Candidatus Cloacimonadota bacterium]